MDSPGFYLLVAGVWSCVALAAAFLWLYLREIAKDERTDMVILEILKQIANAPLQLAQGFLDLFNKGRAEKVSIHVIVAGRKLGADTTFYLLEAQDQKGKPAQPLAADAPVPDAKA